MPDFLSNHPGVGWMGVGIPATASAGIPANALTLGGEQLTLASDNLTLETP